MDEQPQALERLLGRIEGVMKANKWSLAARNCAVAIPGGGPKLDASIAVLKMASRQC
jgi:hypothetical protein